jgi:hypothetical protein
MSFRDDCPVVLLNFLVEYFKLLTVACIRIPTIASFEHSPTPVLHWPHLIWGGLCLYRRPWDGY